MLDVYAPRGAIGLPILLFFHGGAWVSGHLGWLRFMAPVVNAMGFVFVAGSYRLAPRLRWPAQYDDVRDALWFASRNAESFGGDAQQIVIGGHSAGGHLASLVALKHERPSIAACMPVSSSFDLQYGDVPIESDSGRVYRYLFERRDQDHDASPINFADRSELPFHITWGECDFERVRNSSERMVTRLPHSTHDVLPKATHFETHLALKNPGAAFYSRLRGAIANMGAAA
jgi:acetyl esterase/lipase